QHVAPLDMLAFGEQHLLHDAVDLGMDRDGKRGLHRAQTGDVNRHILAGRDCDPDRNRGPPGRGCGANWFGSRNTVPVQTATCQDGERDADHDDAATARSCTAGIVRHGISSGVSAVPSSYVFVSVTILVARLFLKHIAMSKCTQDASMVCRLPSVEQYIPVQSGWARMPLPCKGG